MRKTNVEQSVQFLVFRSFLLARRGLLEKVRKRTQKYIGSLFAFGWSLVKSLKNYKWYMTQLLLAVFRTFMRFSTWIFLTSTDARSAQDVCFVLRGLVIFANFCRLFLFTLDGCFSYINTHMICFSIFSSNIFKLDKVFH